MLRGLSAEAGPGQSSSSSGRQWFAWIPLVAAGFTTLCCLGASAALSLTVGASGLTYWRHRRAGPLVLSAIAATWI